MKWPHRFNRQTYRLLSFTPTREFEAVFDDEGQLVRVVLDGVGVASVVSTDLIQQHEGQKPRAVTRVSWTQVVGLEMTNDTGLEIVDEACNYLGMVRLGQEVPEEMLPHKSLTPTPKKD